MNRQEDGRRRCKGRCRARGAAMVEGVVVIPFFLLIFAGTVFVAGFYGRRIEAQGLARHQTITRAMSESCDEGENGELPGLAIVESEDLGVLSKTPLAALCEKDFGMLSYTARSSYAVSGPYRFEKNIMATAISICNESPIAGEVGYAAAIEFLWDAYQHQGAVPPDVAVPSMIPWHELFVVDAPEE